MNTNELHQLLQADQAEKLRELEIKAADNKLLGNLNQLLKASNKSQQELNDIRQANNNELLKKETEKLMNMATEIIKPQNNARTEVMTKTIISDAIKEAERLVKLSSAAKNINTQKYDKQTDDLVQTSKAEPTPNTKTNSFIEQFAAVAKAIEEEDKVNYRTNRISEDVAVKNQTTQDKKEKDQVELNNQQIKRPQSQNKLDLSMEMDFSNSDHESKGKEAILEKRREKIEGKNSNSSPKNTETQVSSSQQEPPRVNKLKARFRGSHLHF